MYLMCKFVVVVIFGIVVYGVYVVNVFVVLLDFDYFDLKDGKVFVMGFYLNELMQFVKVLFDVGYQVIFVMLEGKVLMLDVMLVDKMYFNGDENVMCDYCVLFDWL